MTILSNYNIFLKIYSSTFFTGMVKAISAGIDVKHCGICNKLQRCILNFNKEVEDKKTGEKRLVHRRIWMRHIPDQNLDKVLEASVCKDYSHNRFFIYHVLNNLRNLPCWEWKRVNK